MSVVRLLSLATLAFLLNVNSAHAALISLNYNFSASGFNAGAPFDPVTGSFSVTFDNAVGQLINVTTGVSLTTNVPIDPVIGFDYRTGDFLYIGRVEVFNLSVATNDFVLQVSNASTNPTLVLLWYSRPGSDLFEATSFSLTPSSPAAVPEPATFSLLALGLVGIAGRRWRQRKAS